MSLYYKLTKRVDPKDPTLVLYGPKPVYSVTMSFESLCNEINKTTLLFGSDVKMIVTSVVDMIIESLLESYSVELGDFGRITLTIGTEQTENPYDYSRSSIRGARYALIMSAKSREILRDVKLVKREKKALVKKG